MSVNCRLFIYQLTTNFLNKYQLTTIFLANCQLTTNPISTLLVLYRGLNDVSLGGHRQHFMLRFQFRATSHRIKKIHCH